MRLTLYMKESYQTGVSILWFTPLHPFSLFNGTGEGEWRTDLLTDDWLTDCLTDWQTDGWTYRPTNWPNEWMNKSCNRRRFSLLLCCSERTKKELDVQWLPCCSSHQHGWMWWMWNVVWLVGGLQAIHVILFNIT